MTGRHLTIVHSRVARQRIGALLGPGDLGIYTGQDFSFFLDLKARVSPGSLTDLGGRFHDTLEDIRKSVLEMAADLNRRLDSDAWWETQLASRSTGPTPLIANLVVLFSILKQMDSAPRPLVVILDSPAVMRCLSEAAVARGWTVTSLGGRRAAAGRYVRSLIGAAVGVTRFAWRCAARRIVVRRAGFPKVTDAPDDRIRVVIRSWITKGTFAPDGTFTDRNFGSLPEQLRREGIDVWMLPMFFNLQAPFGAVVEQMRHSGGPFVFPEQFLTAGDYVRVLWRCLTRPSFSFAGTMLRGVDVGAIFRDVQRVHAFDFGLMELNLCAPLLRHLAARNTRIDAFYYPFENNAVEKPFLRAARRWYRAARTLAYQHSMWPHEQLGMFLAPGEADVHPVADTIVASGPAYLRVLEDAGFPADRIKLGANLRFTAVQDIVQVSQPASGDVWRVLVPLTFEPSQTLELLHAVETAIGQDPRYEIRIRTHPLLKRSQIDAFLKRIGATRVAFADDGSLHDHFRSADVVVSNGSIVVLEAVAAGIPVIRVRPANTIMYEPLGAGTYLIEPVEGSEGLRGAFESLRTLLGTRQVDLAAIGREIRRNYFEPFRPEHLGVFRPVAAPRISARVSHAAHTMEHS